MFLKIPKNAGREGRPSTITTGQKERMLLLYKQGMSYNQIAKELKLNPASVLYWISKALYNQNREDDDSAELPGENL